MSLTDVLKQEAKISYGVTEKLFNLVDASQLSWKPSTGSNWMTMGQLLMHCTNSCGAGIKGFITGDWGLPDDMSFEDIPPDQMMPPAEEMAALAGTTEDPVDVAVGFESLDGVQAIDLALGAVGFDLGADVVLLLGHRHSCSRKSRL